MIERGSNINGKEGKRKKEKEKSRKENCGTATIRKEGERKEFGDMGEVR